MSFRKISMLLACLGAAGAFYGCDGDVNDMISSCQPGAYKCNGDTLQVCYGLNWSSIECPTGCDASTGACRIPEGAECAIDTCKNDTTVNKCINGKFTEVACNAGETCLTGLGCRTSSSPETNCTDGNKRCNGQSLELCSNNAWESLEFCENGCDDASLVCKTVQPGEVCAGNTCKDEHTRVICADDKMSTSEENCADDEICSNGECVKKGDPTVECTGNEVKCSDDNQGTIACKEDGTWDEVEACPTGEVCDIDQKKCVPEADAKVCNDTDIKCAGQPGVLGDIGYFECRDGKWAEDPSEFKKCPDGQICSQEENKCVENPSPECTKDDIKCVDEKTYLVCDESSGFWSTGIGNCEEGLVCDLTQNKCVPKAETQCQKDEIKCADDGNYYTCVDGSWSAETTACGDGKYCDTKSNKCEDSCQADTYKCSEDKSELLKCDNHVWVEATKCKEKQLCVDGSCKDLECTPGVNFCDNTIKTPVVYKCTEDGKKGEAIDSCKATFQCTEDGTACLICKDGDVQCSDKGVFQVCENNAWVDIVDCGDVKSCRTANGGGFNNYNGCVCSLGNGVLRPDTKCSADEKSLLTCTEKEAKGVKYHDWESLSCDGGKCEELNTIGTQKAYACSCKGDDYSCIDNSLYQCRDGRLQLRDACQANETCDKDKAACLCQDKTYQCLVETPIVGEPRIIRQVCVDGKWNQKDAQCGNKSATCAGEYGLCAISKYVCVGDETTCYGRDVMKCVNGIYEVSQSCAADEVCSVTGYPATAGCHANSKCQNGQKRCVGAMMQTCENHSWKDTACEDGKVCMEVGGAGGKKTIECRKKVCDDYTFTCDKDKIQICMDNELHNYGDCSEINMTCKEGVCVSK